MGTEAKVRTFIVDELGFVGPAEDLVVDYPLLAREVLDSMGIFQLVAFLEHDFGILIDDEDLVPENFESIGSIARFVGAKQG